MNYTIDEVSKHNIETDCWIIINNIVYNVTEFLNQHPGGVSSIARNGRAGCDVTIAFEQIGHSNRANNLLKSMEIGRLIDIDLGAVGGVGLNIEKYNSNSNSSNIVIEDEYDETHGLLISSDDTSSIGTTSTTTSSTTGSNSNRRKKLPIDDPEKDAGPLWHANRRKAILRDHPEVAELMGSNPWTCGIGLATVIIHCGTCIYVQGQQVSWWYMFVLAYTVGALCKMCQFAVNHDLIHDTAGSFVASSDLLKRSAMQLFTLPSIGGTMHLYYENQHLGHHTSLGNQGLTDMASSGGDEMRIEKLRTMLFFPESDGDLLAIGNMSYGEYIYVIYILEVYMGVYGCSV